MTTDQLDKLGRGRRLRVAVVGDIMLDVYRYGEIERISPEFPVPILKEEYDQPILRPGGAANVAAQFVHMNADVSLYGFADRECIESISGFGFDASRVVELVKGKVPRKVRLFAKNHPVLRMDREIDNCGVESLNLERIQVYSNLVHDMQDGFDVIIFSNYAKGLFDRNLCSLCISSANSYGIPTVVDPKNNPSWWNGCTVFKPNFKEAKSMCPGKSVEETIYCLLRESGSLTCVITREADGVLVGSENGIRNYTPTRLSLPVEASSVIGAGDCFAAMLAYGVGHGLPVYDASGFAFEAASEYVKARHNRPVSFYEARKRIEPHKAKIVTADEVEYIRKNVFPEQTWVFTNGCMDVLHPGHLDSIKRARDLGHRLIVAINTDESIKRLKGEERPIFNLEDRCAMVAGLKDVDFVVPFSEDNPYSLIEKINPDIVVKGDDYKGKPITGPGFTGKTVYLPLLSGYSTTEIIRRIRGRQ